ncbi:hypothetical protein POM88_029973 [Heracleum sosnowskyi]|uniref:Disease resistance protein At4g27190-like leucine-rich repeats domain-containing protein n=1 Tax=Heracleum sosnowskyi TaxID=360622 RepID=A0AAD8HXQ9_9APIA|nr:hypothetical protein POM88_029973 [Heracleum sosnowskyi]
MKVDNCGLSNLFTVSTLRGLQQLRILEISNCRFLEGIADDVIGDESLDTNDKIITLSNLSDVFLKHLPKLRSFSSTANYSFSMPKLKIAHLFACPQVETFTSMELSTALVYLHTEWYYAKKAEDLPVWYIYTLIHKFIEVVNDLFSNSVVYLLRRTSSSLL